MTDAVLTVEQIDLAERWAAIRYNEHDCPPGMATITRHVILLAQAVQSLRRDVPGWKPIETAPKDGSTILLLVPTLHKKWNDQIPLAGYWEEREENNGFFVIFNADEAIQRVDPTHWMPLPEAPASGEK